VNGVAVPTSAPPASCFSISLGSARFKRPTRMNGIRRSVLSGVFVIVTSIIYCAPSNTTWALTVVYRPYMLVYRNKEGCLPDGKRKRRPGGGRKPIDPQGAVIAPVRFTHDEWEAINRVGKRYKLKRSQVIRAAVKYWLRLTQYPQLHVAALTFAIPVLIKKIETRTRRKWIEDPATGAAVREEVARLIDSLVPEAKEPPVILPELRQVARDLIVIIAHLYQDPQSAPVFAGDDDWAALKVIAKDLGPALLRNANKAVVTITEVKKREKR